jgi:hypothetical protein
VAVLTLTRLLQSKRVRIPEITGGQKVLGPLRFPHSLNMKKLFLFIQEYTFCDFHDPCKTAHPVVDDTLGVIKMGSFHADAVASSISSFESNLRFLRLPFNLQKSSKSHGRMSGE